MTTQFRKERNSVSDLKIHWVCVSKYRRAVLTTESLELIKKSFNEVAKKMNFQVLEFNGEADHVRALIEYPPKLSISQMVNALKGVSSRRYGQAGHPKPYGKDALWSPSYFVSSVGGAPIEILKPYIRKQEKRTAHGEVSSPCGRSKKPS
ncbi:MAG: IS200/IS605 family transposase [Cyanobacteriota bacterium]|nr:IS200/IS605 family transposase [Cyanobacteriota bacterium]